MSVEAEETYTMLDNSGSNNIGFFNSGSGNLGINN
jgi:hypothetical protein